MNCKYWIVCVLWDSLKHGTSVLLLFTSSPKPTMLSIQSDASNVEHSVIPNEQKLQLFCYFPSSKNEVHVLNRSSCSMHLSFSACCILTLPGHTELLERFAISLVRLLAHQYSCRCRGTCNVWITMLISLWQKWTLTESGTKLISPCREELDERETSANTHLFRTGQI